MKRKYNLWNIGKKILVTAVGTALLAAFLYGGKEAKAGKYFPVSVTNKLEESVLDSSNLQKNKSYSLDDKIPVAPSFPPGWTSFVNWEFKKDLKKEIYFDVNIKKFDTSKDFYLQLYQGFIGDDGFYFGIQNRTKEKDQMLIFSRWFDDVKVAKRLGINEPIKYPEKVRAVKAYKNLFKKNPSKRKEYKKFAEAHAIKNPKEGFIQSAIYEGAFVGVRLPNFNLKNEKYRFSIIKDKEDGEGTWYRYEVMDHSTYRSVFVGALRFDKGAEMKKDGATWIELFGKPWSNQTYRNLPKWDFEISSIKGDGAPPIHATSIYKNPRWNKDIIPFQNISYSDNGSNKGAVRVQIGPDVVRKNKAGRLF